MTDEQQDETPTADERVKRVNYPANSNTARPKTERSANYGKKPEQSEKKVQKVIQGEATQRKKSLGSKIRETFTGDDFRSVGNFILFDVVVPAVKTTIADALSQGTERALFGESRRNSASRYQARGYTNYSSYSSRSPVGRAGEPDGPRVTAGMSNRGRATHDFDEIVLETRGDADAVLDSLSDLVRQYDVATVADLYEMVGISGQFTDNKWGWTSMAGSGVTRARNGYLLDLPRPIAID